MADRRTLAQQPPDPDIDYTGFPAHTSGVDRAWYRSHTDRPSRTDRGVWWFASSPESAASPASGRFDLPEPEGTCYLAETQAASVNELIGPDVAARGWVEAALVTGRVVSRVQLPHATRAANVSVSKASAFRVTSELTSTGDYDLTQDWARTFRQAGFDGIRYALRFTPGKARGLALFGGAGAPDPTWPGDEDPQQLRAQVERMGVEVVGTPSSASVSLVTP